MLKSCTRCSRCWEPLPAGLQQILWPSLQCKHAGLSAPKNQNELAAHLLQLWPAPCSTGQCLQVKMALGPVQQSWPSMLPAPAAAALDESPALDQVRDINDLNVMLRCVLTAAMAPYGDITHYLEGCCRAVYLCCQHLNQCSLVYKL